MYTSNRWSSSKVFSESKSMLKLPVVPFAHQQIAETWSSSSTASCCLRSIPDKYRSLLNVAAYTLHRLLSQLGEPEERAKVTTLIKIPTGKKVKQGLDKWWSELEKHCYYFEEEDGVCQSPRLQSPSTWVEESEQAEVNPWRAVYGDPLQ